MSVGIIAAHECPTIANVPGQSHWMDAGGGVYQTSGGSSANNDGDPVGVWRDKINGRDAVQGTPGQRPVLKKAIYNGQDTLRFDGTDDQLLIAGTTDDEVANITVFIVAKATSAGGRVLIGKNQNASGWSSPYMRWGLYDDGTYNTRWNGAQLAQGSWSTGDLKIIEMVNADVYANGVKVVDGTDSPLTYPSGHTPIHISGNGVGSEFWNGDIAMVGIWPRALTIVERNAVRAALALQYGISSVDETVPTEPFKPAAITYSGNGSPSIDENMPIGAKMYLFTWEYTRLQGLDATAPTITGWSLVTKGNTGTGDGGGIRMCAFEKTCQSGDPGSTVTPSYQGASGLWAYAGVVGYDKTVNHDTATNHVPSASSTAITTTLLNEKIIYAVGAYRSNGGAGLSIVNPGGGVVTDLVAAGDVSDTHGAVKLAIETQAAIGTSTVRTWTEANGVPGSEMGVLAIPILSPVNFSFVAGSNASTGTGMTTFACSHPAGLAVGDQLIAVVKNTGTTTATGWTVLQTSGFTFNGFTDAGHLMVKTATSGDVSAGSTTFTGSGRWAIAMCAWRGATILSSSVLRVDSTNTSTPNVGPTVSLSATKSTLVVSGFAGGVQGGPAFMTLGAGPTLRSRTGNVDDWVGGLIGEDVYAAGTGTSTARSVTGTQGSATFQVALTS